MALCHGSNYSETAKKEQIITECFAKTLHIILESRCPYVSSRNYSGEQGLSSPCSSSSSPSSVRSRDKWFNLALKDCPAALEKIDFWRQSNLEPMVVDVVLVQRSSNEDLLNSYAKSGPARKLSQEEFGNVSKSEKIIERWVLQYETRKTNNAGTGVPVSRRSISTSTPTLYKKSILLLRSLYVTVRLLPAYKLFRDLISSARIRTYYLCHRVSSFVEPFTHTEEAGMQQFVFDPVETSCGRLCLSVLYTSSVFDLISEPSMQMTHQLIPDYVGSPLAEPLKKFPSGPQLQGCPSFSPFGRRHSWSDLHRAPPHSGISSPSSTNSEPHALFSKPHSLRLPPTVPPQVMVKNAGYDEYWPSPNFSPSLSPSPPTNTQNRNISKVLLRTESAPDSIPMTRPSGIPLPSNNQILPPHHLLRFTKSNVPKTEGHSNMFPTSSTVDKLLQFGKDDAGVKTSSHSSPFSRSPSRLSFQDDYDDSEYFGPFLVDDDDATDSGSRGRGSFEQIGMCDSPRESSYRRSGDAAVGALVSMLHRASPLRQDFGMKSGNYMADSNRNLGNQGSQSSTTKICASSGLSSSKTTDDALEELRVYKEMKSSLLKKR